MGVISCVKQYAVLHNSSLTKQSRCFCVSVVCSCVGVKVFSKISNHGHIQALSKHYQVCMIPHVRKLCQSAFSVLNFLVMSSTFSPLIESCCWSSLAPSIDDWLRVTGGFGPLLGRPSLPSFSSVIATGSAEKPATASQQQQFARSALCGLEAECRNSRSLDHCITSSQCFCFTVDFRTVLLCRRSPHVRVVMLVLAVRIIREYYCTTSTAALLVRWNLL